MSSSYPKLKIEYFNSPGRGEAARACLWIADIPFEDVRMTFPEFLARKAAGAYPRGQVPVLYVNDTIIPQSNAIARYCAKLAGLYPTDPVEALKVDAIVDSYNDAIIPIGLAYREKDATRQEELKKAIIDTSLPDFLGYVEGIVAANGTGFAVGNSLTFVDILLLQGIYDRLATKRIDWFPATLVDKFPKFKAWAENIEKNDKVKKWRTLSAAAEADATKRIAEAEAAKKQE